MILQSLLEDNRLIWQKRTQEEILNSLLQRSHQYKLMGHRDEKLVMVFGKSHAGKTTLILSLMGIKEKLLKEVTLILRAGIPEGNSSTSTSIIYQKSDDDMFGVLEKNISDVSNNIYKCGEEEFINYLKKVRERVEQGNRSLDKVLYIYLPKHYFEDNKNNDSLINILDVPGYETTNEKEKSHTNALLNKYMAISSLNIVIRSIYDINDLRYFVAPNRDDVSKLATSRYLIITTRSYSQENIFKYFLKPKEQRTGSFEELIQNECKNQFQRICGEAIPRVYPVDLGESFDELINNKIKNSEDREYLIAYRNKVFSDIFSVIKQRQSNTLKSWVDELLEDEEFYGKIELKSFIDKKEELNKTKKEKEGALKKRKDYLRQIKHNLSNLQADLEKHKNNQKRIPIPETDGVTEAYVAELKKAYFNENYSWKKKNSNNNVADLFALAFREAMADYLLKLKDHDLFTYQELLNNSTYSTLEEKEINLREELDSEMNAHKVFKVLNPSNKEKIEYIGRQKLQQALDEYLTKFYTEYSLIIQRRIDELVSNSLNNHIILQKEEERKIKEIKNELNRVDISLKDNEKHVNEVNYRVEKDKETIKEYREIAHKNYNMEKERIIKDMNMEQDPVVKLEYAMLLGLMQKDYEKLVMG